MAPDPFAELSPPYATIAADPPWPFRWGGGPGGRRARATVLPYSTMTLDDITALPVAELAGPDAYLFLWSTRDVYREGHAVAVARAWGFEPFGEIIWRKPNFGTGAFPRAGHEPLLLARRGDPPPIIDRSTHSVQTWKQPYDRNGGKGHSRKPDGAIDLIERVTVGPRLELFARTPRFGWDSWGYGYEGHGGNDG